MYFKDCLLSRLVSNPLWQLSDKGLFMQEIAKKTNYHKYWFTANKLLQHHLVKVLPPSKLGFYQWIHSTDVIEKPVT